MVTPEWKTKLRASGCILDCSVRPSLGDFINVRRLDYRNGNSKSSQGNNDTILIHFTVCSATCIDFTQFLLFELQYTLLSAKHDTAGRPHFLLIKPQVL